MSASALFLAIILLFTRIYLIYPESFRTILESSIEVTPEAPSGTTVSAGINSSVFINLGAETRFLRGIEVEIASPPAWLSYRGSLAMAVYNNANVQILQNSAEINADRIGFEPLPSRRQIIYQIPVRQSHGLRTTTSVTVPTAAVLPSAFPVLFRIMPVIKGISDELENMTFNITVRPIISDEGAIRLIPRFPPQLPGRPFTIMIDDSVISNISEQIVLKEGEHHLVILSDYYRNESRRFIVERTKVVDLIIELQDLSPVIIFEGPQNALIYIDNVQIPRNRDTVTAEPGPREIRFVVGDYTVTRTLNVQRGKTYRIALNVDLAIQEEE